MAPPLMIDKHFNREWVGSTHRYLDNTLDRSKGTVSYPGWIKVKLLQGKKIGLLRTGGRDWNKVENLAYAAQAKGWLSFIAPDIIILDGHPQAWIQPLHFLPNRLWRDKGGIFAELWIDISCAQTVMAGFKDTDFVCRFEDGSELYECKILGPTNLLDYATGPALLYDNRPYVQLFHHTSEEALAKIHESGHLRPSSWNIQGTKELQESVFVYFTSIPKLDCENCLGAVAMANEGMLRLRRDPPPVPPIFVSHNLALFGSDILEIEVRRESTKNRTATLDLWIDAGYLSPQHLLRHFDGRNQYWYEIMSPFSARIELSPGSILPFYHNGFECGYENVRHSNKVIVGDAWRLDGLAAPFHEDTTQFILKIQRVKNGNVLTHWFNMGPDHGYDVVTHQ